MGNIKNVERTIILSPETADELKRYAASNHITVSKAMRDFIEKGLSVQSYEQHQSEIRKYIREEIENTLSVLVKRYVEGYMERLIKMQANATRSSAAALMATVAVISENYIDTATPEEILANSLKMATRITKTKVKSDSEYLQEAREWLAADLGKPSDSN